LVQLEWRHKSLEHDFLARRYVRLMVLIEDLLARLMAQRHGFLLDQRLSPSSISVKYLAICCLATVPADLLLHLLF